MQKKKIPAISPPPQKPQERPPVKVQLDLPGELHFCLRRLALEQNSTLRQVIIDTLQSAVK